MNLLTLSNALKSVFGNTTVNNPSSSSLIPYCSSTGVPEGLSSMSNLASVLGGLTNATVASLNGDMNNMSPFTLYKIPADQASTLENSPFTNISFVAIMFGTSTRGIAIAATYMGTVKMRVAYDVWRSWVSIN